MRMGLRATEAAHLFPMATPVSFNVGGKLSAAKEQVMTALRLGEPVQGRVRHEYEPTVPAQCPW